MNGLFLVVVIIISLLWVPLALVHFMFGEDVYFEIIDYFNIMHGNFKIGIITKRFNNIFFYFRGSQLGKMWFSLGLVVVFLTKVFYFLYFSYGIYRLIVVYLPPLIFGSRIATDSSIPIGVLVPGVNLPIHDFIPMTIAAIIVMIVHEIGHSIASECEGVGIESFSIYLFLVMPIAAVEMNEKRYAKLNVLGRLRILSAGVFHNVMFLVVLYLFSLFWSSRLMMESMKEIGYLEVRENNIPGIQDDLPPSTLVWEVNGRTVWDVPDIQALYEEEILLPGICVDKAITFLGEGIFNGILGSQNKRRRRTGRYGRSTVDDCCTSNLTNVDPKRICFTSGSLESCIEARKIFKNRRCDTPPNLRPDNIIGRPDGRVRGGRRRTTTRCEKSEICVIPKDRDYRVVGFLTTSPEDVETNKRLKAIFRLLDIQKKRLKHHGEDSSSSSSPSLLLDQMEKEEEEWKEQKMSERSRLTVTKNNIQQKGIRLKKEILYYGRVGDFLHLLKFGDFRPRYGIPFHLHFFVKKIVSFLWVMSIGFALLNLPPFSSLDGERIFNEIDNFLMGWTRFDRHAWLIGAFQRVREVSLSLVILNISAVILVPLVL